MRHGWVVMVAMLAVVLTLAGCGSSSNDLGDAFATEAKEIVDYTQPCEGIYDNAFNLEVINQTSYGISEYYIVSSLSETWGENLLENGSIPAGATGWLCDVRPCGQMLDYRMLFSDGYEIEGEDWGIASCGQAYDVTFVEN